MTPAADFNGLLVVSLEQALAAPLASSRLADAGARVIKLERREGDFARTYDSCVNGLSSYFVWVNHGKESAFFDLKAPADVTMFFRMLEHADVFIQNLAPGATERAGIGSATLRARFPRLITCDISGYGDEGPYRDMKAYDLLIQAESGLAALSGTADGPGRVGISICDIACGVSAYGEIVRALYVRERTGCGRGVAVSLFHSIAEWLNVPYLQRRYGGQTPAGRGLHHPTIAPYGAYPCADGSEILIAIQNEREWVRFCALVLGDEAFGRRLEFASNNARVEHRAALDRRLHTTFGALTRAQATSRLAAAGTAFAKLSSLDDLLAHPQNRFICIETAGGAVELLAPPGALDWGSYGFVPEPGQHDVAIRREFSE